MKKIYFASDFHLGLKFKLLSPQEQESKIINWLNFAAQDAAEIYLLGDIFDFWFEYKLVIPKGFVRFLGKLAELVDRGIKIHYFVGNHDIWHNDYLEKEIGLTLYRQPITIEYSGKKFFLAHGDGLGKGDFFYQILHFIFHNKILWRLYKAMHPRFGLGFGYAWSSFNRGQKGIAYPFQGEKEPMYQFAVKYLSEQDSKINYFIFGHRHTPITLPLSPTSEFVLLSDWITNSYYCVFDGEDLTLSNFRQS